MDTINHQTSKAQKEMEEWRDYQKFVLHELERLNENVEKITETYVSQGKEIVTLKTENKKDARLSGGVWGFAAAIGCIILEWWINKPPH